MNRGAESAPVAAPSNGSVLDQPRRLADYVVNKEDRGRSRVWMVLWLAVGPIFRSGLGGTRLRTTILRMFGASVLPGCVVHRSTRVHYPWKLSLGEHVHIAAGVWIINPEPVSIGSRTLIDRDVVICAGGHDHRSPTFTRTSEAVSIGDHCTLGHGATVLKGVSMPPGKQIRSLAVVVPATSGPSRSDQ